VEPDCEEEDKSNSKKITRLEELLTLEQLTELKDIFFGAVNEKNVGGKKLSKNEFGKEIRCLLKDTALELHMSRIFSKMGVPDGGSVDWEAFCSYMLAQYLEKDTLKQKTPPFQDLPRVRNMYSKDTICRIVSLQGPTRILTVCKVCNICTYVFMYSNASVGIMLAFLCTVTKLYTVRTWSSLTSVCVFACAKV
jgi:hypothetical protein